MSKTEKKNYTPGLNSGLQEQLSALTKSKQLIPKKTSKIHAPRKAPEGIDGVDHINVTDDAVTSLGRSLSYRAKRPFVHTHFGNFNSVEGFWYYIQSVERDDRLRIMNAMAIKKFASKLTKRPVAKNFKAIILDANYQKIINDRRILAEIKDSILPFENYYTNEHGIKIRPKYFFWMLPGLEEIRTAIKEDRLPDFTSMYDDQKIGLFGGVIDKIVEQPKARGLTNCTVPVDESSFVSEAIPEIEVPVVNGVDAVEQ